MNKVLKKYRGFTLAEVIIITAIASLILAGVYRIFATTMTVFSKSDAKMSNFRAADLAIEQFRTDIKDALVFDSGYNFNSDSSSGFVCSFRIIEKEHLTRKEVKYFFKDGSIIREFNGKKKNLTHEAKVKEFKVIECHPTDSPNGEPFALLLNILVDRDSPRPEEKRSVSDKKNIVSLKAVLYPKFFSGCQTTKEKFWGEARKQAGSSNI